jgi:AcrR family transcriptional regulator
MNSSAPVPERLLAVATDLFAREGFDAVSVRDITSRARANLGAVTYHFGSKEALFHAVIDRTGSRFADRFTAIAGGDGPPLTRIARIVTMVLTERDLPAPSMILRELANDRPLPPPLLRLMQRNLGTIMALIREGQRDGSIRAGEPRLLAFSVMAQPFLLRIASRIPRDVAGVDRADPGTQRRLVDHVVTTVRRSLATHPERRP